MKKRILKWGLILLVSGIIIGGAVIYFMFNQPHRNIQAATVDYKLEASALVKEFLTDATKANNKYLDEEGESKIIAISGTVASISEDLNNQKVLFLKTETDKAGVSCTFTTETNMNTENFKVGDQASIKGVIRSGAGYDEDLELYEDVILEKCNIIQN
ncbi:MAG: hypothetical protein GQ540_02735 [Lutibacter sp.]|uniref:OB-fold protein n=1 Tax=Lutibacter sp. TaxID=1925666 RepID=UPI0019EC570B|nr:hypothetical protein [Lutibacter sp.]NOR27425.1 hypothetical protein [Lutibacter sp.]